MTPELETFAAAFRARVEGMAAATPPHPDVIDVIDRALALGNGEVPTGLRASALAACQEDAAEEPAPDLAPFAGALRQRIASTAAERQMKPTPAVPTRERSRRIWIVAAIAVAAAAVVAVALPRLGSVAERDAVSPELMGAEQTATERTTPGDAAFREPGAAVEPSPRAPAPRLEPQVQAEGDVEAEEPEPSHGEVTDDEPEPKTAATTKDRGDRATNRELEERAHDLWRAGDLAGSERLLRRIIRRAGRSRQGELAYGDLMAVARQRGGAAAQAAIWREYLGKFPRGRFSDDARGGLCRRAAAPRRSECWSRYLDDYPNGAHAAEARRHAAP